MRAIIIHQARKKIMKIIYINRKMELTNTDYDKRKQFLEDLKKLVKSEQEEIFRIIKRSKVEYSENSNGIFFDVLKLSKETFDKIQEFMNFCKENRIDFSKREKEMTDLKVLNEDM